MAGRKAPQGERTETRLTVIDLATKKQTIIDEPGATCGYCWSPDGSRIAYTWQKPLDHPSEENVRETLLITCNADGTERNVVTSRTHELSPNSSGRSGVVRFFTVFDWR
jgi:Tol biopolymer transport system component